MKPRLLCYNKYSESAKNLKKYLIDKGFKGTKRISPTSTTFSPKKTHFIINWGLSTTPYEEHVDLNSVAAVQCASNKLSAFTVMQSMEVSIPKFTTSTEEAQGWINSGMMVVGRKLLRAHSGNGIILFENEQILPEDRCPLYVQYKKKKAEYRIHVFDGKIIDEQQKRKVSGGEANQYIRNHSNGWVFCREDIEVPQQVKDEAIKAVNALLLDFGAADVIWNEYEGRAYVLEVNTAPGLTGTTLESYGNALIERISNAN